MLFPKTLYSCSQIYCTSFSRNHCISFSCLQGSRLDTCFVFHRTELMLPLYCRKADPPVKAFAKKSLFQVDMRLGRGLNSCDSSPRVFCSFSASMATLALKEAVNFLLVVFMVTEIIELLNFCPNFLDHYTEALPDKPGKTTKHIRFGD